MFVNDLLCCGSGSGTAVGGGDCGMCVHVCVCVFPFLIFWSRIIIPSVFLHVFNIFWLEFSTRAFCKSGFVDRYWLHFDIIIKCLTSLFIVIASFAWYSSLG